MNVYNIIPPAGNVTGTTLQIQYSLLMEYTTENQTPVVSSEAYSNEVVNEMWQILSKTNTFSENPLHMEKFMQAVRDAMTDIGHFYGKHREGFRNLFTALQSFGLPIVSAIGRAGNIADGLYGKLS